MDMTKATLMSQEMAEKSKVQDDIYMMPPPQSPLARFDKVVIKYIEFYSFIYRKINASTTPGRDSHPSFRSPIPDHDFFINDNITDCHAVPHHLFSPARQAKFVSDNSFQSPKYQDIPIDYNPRSVETPGLDRFLLSPAPAGAMPPSPAAPAPPSSSPAPSSTTPVTRLVVVRPPSASSLTSPTPPFDSSSANQIDVESLPPISIHPVRILSKFKSENKMKTRSSLNTKLEELAKNAESTAVDRSEIFKKMNELVNEESESISETSSVTSDMALERTETEATTNEVKDVVVQHKEILTPIKKVQMMQFRSPPTPENVPKGSWRFTSDIPEPQMRTVKVKSNSEVRKLLMGEDCDKVTIQVRPLVDQSMKREAEKSEENTAKKLKTELKKVTRPPELKEKKVRFFCEECGRRCSTLSEIKSHPCDPKVKCEDCGIYLANKKILDQHLKLLHPFLGTKHNCEYCPKSCNNKTLLKEHVIKFHPEEHFDKLATSNQELNELLCFCKATV